MHRRPSGYGDGKNASNILGALLPLLILSGSLLNSFALTGLLLYPRKFSERRTVSDRAIQNHGRCPFFLMLGKFAELQGLAEYYLSRWTQQSTSLGYKNAQ